MVGVDWGCSAITFEICEFETKWTAGVVASLGRNVYYIISRGRHAE